MSSSIENNDDLNYFDQAQDYIQTTAIDEMKTDLKILGFLHPVSDDTTVRTVSNTQRQTRIQSCMYILYFIINAMTRKRVFRNNPEEPPSRETIDVRQGPYNVITLTEEYLSHFLTDWLKEFHQFPDLQFCFTFASGIMNVMGWSSICEECGERFVCHNSLRSHVFMGHAGDKYEMCSFYQCNTICKDLRTLINHQVEVHGAGTNFQKNVISFQLLQNEVIRVAAMGEGNRAAPVSSRTRSARRRSQLSQHSGMSCNLLSTSPQSISSPNYTSAPPEAVISAIMNIPSTLSSTRYRNAPPLSRKTPGSDPDSPGEKMNDVFQFLTENHPFGTGEL